MFPIKRYLLCLALAAAILSRLKASRILRRLVLNLFFQDSHGLFNVIINDLDLNFLQISRPLFAV
jgi:hypothetical protein